MPTAARETIMAAIAARLGGIVAVPGLTVERDREAAVTDATLPLLVVYEGDEKEQPDLTGEDGRSLPVEIEGFAGGATTAAATLALATLRAEVDKALLGDVTLGVGARDLRLADEPPPARLDLDAAPPTRGFARGYVVEYATAEGDPYTIV